MKTSPWSTFESRRIAEPASKEVDDFAIVHARLFSSPDGRAWLERMRNQLFGVSISPDISNEHLRFLEGQRQLIRNIDREIALGDAQIKLARQNQK
jgi:hypothetical protein